VKYATRIVATVTLVIFGIKGCIYNNERLSENESNLVHDINEEMVISFHSGDHESVIRNLIFLSSQDIHDPVINNNCSTFFWVYHYQLESKYGFTRQYIYNEIISHAEMAYTASPRNIDIKIDLAMSLMIPMLSFKSIEFDKGRVVEVLNDIVSTATNESDIAWAESRLIHLHQKKCDDCVNKSLDTTGRVQLSPLL